MPNQHRSNPVTFRPPEDDRVRLHEAAAATGRPVGAILTEALRLWLDLSEGDGLLIREVRRDLAREAAAEGGAGRGDAWEGGAVSDEVQTRVDSYDRNSRCPRVGSVYVWELDEPHACELIKVTEVTWNGEEWWVRTELLHKSLANTSYSPTVAPQLNDLSRFWEAVTLVREVPR